ncbi:MAG: DUF935 family protein [Verrucomicrobia bacterium]|nr:DUF935 family protein [Verrucomicrobiota bacterium]
MKPAQPKVGAERARMFRLTYASPIRGITPARLVAVLDAWERGQLREAALLWQKILDRDDQARPCDAKRRRAVTGLEWEILPVDDSPEAAEHKAALEACYNNLTALNALNEHERGGVRLLFRQMMSAVGLRYAAHEIVWQPAAPGGLTAEFRFIPLQFFENTTGRLRYLTTDAELSGAELDEFFGEGAWMVTAGEGLMEATSVAWMFKTPNGLKAWVNFCEKYGIPGLHGKTNAAQDSAEWDAMKDALSGFGEDLAILTNDGASITPIEIKNAGTSPHKDLVDRMDRAISRIWLGGDLATMSAGSQAVGSQAQTPELENLLRDDAAMITDALQHFVDRRVIEYRFGPGIAPKAYFKLLPPAEVNVDRELKTDEFLLRSGVEIAKSDLRARYGRAEPKAGEDLATVPAAPGGTGLPTREAALNENAFRLDELARLGREKVFRAESLAQLSAAQRSALAPLVDRLREIEGMEDGDQQDAALAKLQRDLPQLYRAVLRDPAVAQAFEEILGTALIDGAASAAAKQSRA